MYQALDLSPTGATGNNTHTGVFVSGSYEAIAFEFIVQAIGATPTVTWKVQGTLDDPSITDANANWYDVGYITDATDTIAVAARTLTTVSAQIGFVANPVARRFQRFRLVTSANTNVTYYARVYRINSN